jgi:hypothetical protein
VAGLVVLVVVVEKAGSGEGAGGAGGGEGACEGGCGGFIAYQAPPQEVWGDEPVVHEMGVEGVRGVEGSDEGPRRV